MLPFKDTSQEVNTWTELGLRSNKYKTESWLVWSEVKKNKSEQRHSGLQK